MIDMITTRTEREAAFKLGSEEFKKGTPCRPIASKKFMEMIKGEQIGGKTTELAQAWLKGWIVESIKTDVE